MGLGSSARLWGALSLALLVGACGDEAETVANTQPPETSRCGPNGVLHQAVGVEPHCDCDPGFVQSGGTCIAAPTTSPPPGSGGSAPDCGPNGVYDGQSCDCDVGYTQTGVLENRTCEAIPPCQSDDDGYEPNDAPSDATVLSEVQGPLYACPADGDWYIFPVTAGDRVSVDISFDGASVDLDLFLFGPSSRSAQAYSISVRGNSEVADFVARAEGTAGIFVMPYGIGQGTYQMNVSIEEGEPPMCAGPGAFCRSNPDCCSGVCHVGHCH